MIAKGAKLNEELKKPMRKMQTHVEMIDQMLYLAQEVLKSLNFLAMVFLIIFGIRYASKRGEKAK